MKRPAELDDADRQAPHGVVPADHRWPRPDDSERCWCAMCAGRQHTRPMGVVQNFEAAVRELEHETRIATHRMRRFHEQQRWARARQEFTEKVVAWCFLCVAVGVLLAWVVG